MPVGAKLLQTAIPTDNFVKYRLTPLELKRERPLISDITAGINVDLVDSSLFYPPAEEEVDLQAAQQENDPFM